MANPNQQAVKDAERNNEELAVLFGRYLGSRKHPRGRLLSLYRNQRRLLAKQIRDGESIGRLELSLQSFSIATGAVITDAILASGELGTESAKRQVGYFIAAGLAFNAANGRFDSRSLLRPAVEAVNQQLSLVRAAIASNVHVSEIVGSGARMGVLQPFPIQRELARLMAMGVSSAFDEHIGADTPFHKQAVAVIDLRTTDCCRKVNGQIQPKERPFLLTGTPRYADRAMAPPFHNYCRTSVALFLERMEG